MWAPSANDCVQSVTSNRRLGAFEADSLPQPASASSTARATICGASNLHLRRKQCADVVSNKEIMGHASRRRPGGHSHLVRLDHGMMVPL